MTSDKLRGVYDHKGKGGFIGHGGNFDLTLAILKEALAKHAYIAGESFTAADIVVGYQIALGFFLNVSLIY